ncbi:hypothetical protein ABSDF3325 [Acinetobacter baumannii SDF]|uniref:Uncharacterized protein n=2 Tax=Acinetobacter baumannii TaxID=470 RepID=B0VMI0_ACIBS|nr:hypothetical protein ABSDF3325 [Acinetobacter baumannii SDF]
MFQLTPELLDEDLPKVMDLEQSLRSGSMMSIDVINDLKDPFWKELAVILFAYRFFKNMDLYNLNLLKNLCQSDPVIYFLAKKSDELIEKGFSNEIST